MDHMLETPVHPSGTQSGENPEVGSISRKDLSIVWIAAAIDAEGCISANRWKQTNPDPRYKGRIGLRLSVKIYNTHPLFIRKVTQCLVDIGVRFTVTGQAARKNGDRPGVTVCIDAIPQVKKLLLQIVEHLCAKQRQAELALEFIRYRESLIGAERGSKGRYQALDLANDERALWLFAEIKREKSDFPSVFSFSRKPNVVFGESSETLRPPSASAE